MVKIIFNKKGLKYGFDTEKEELRGFSEIEGFESCYKLILVDNKGITRIQIVDDVDIENLVYLFEGGKETPTDLS